MPFSLLLLRFLSSFVACFSFLFVSIVYHRHRHRHQHQCFEVKSKNTKRSRSRTHPIPICNACCMLMLVYYRECAVYGWHWILDGNKWIPEIIIYQTKYLKMAIRVKCELCLVSLVYSKADDFHCVFSSLFFIYFCFFLLWIWMLFSFCCCSIWYCCFLCVFEYFPFVVLII